MLKDLEKLKLLLLILVTVTAVSLSRSWPPPWSQGLAVLLLVVWPTATWSQRQTGSIAEKLVTAGGFVLLLNALLVLLLAYLPGPMSRGPQLIVHWLVAGLPLIIRKQPAANQGVVKTNQLKAIVLTLLVLIVLRLPNLGYSEFQGDEGVIMTRAAGVILGDDAELFLHQKGPIEIVIPLGLWNLAGSLDETSARLQFAWASGLAMLALICLADRWFRPPVGLIAGLLFAISGFATAFGRIVQYQSFVMLWGALALLHLSRYRARGRAGDLILAALFLAGGLLAHYDAILVVPAALALWVPQITGASRARWRHFAFALLLGALVLAVFYIPFLMSPSFGRTGAYLIGARLGAGEGNGLLSWSGSAVWQMLTFYNSIYFVFFLASLTLVGLGLLERNRSYLAAVLYLFAPFLFYLFIVADPRTHVYTIFSGAAILAAAALDSLGRKLWQKHHPFLYRAGYLIFGLVVIVSVNYVYLLFIDHTPERQRTWSENRPQYYPSSWTEPPLYGLFGFPHQAGWRVVADLLPETAFPYASNEEEEITNLYLSQAPRTHCLDYQSFILTQDTQDELPYDRAYLDTLNLQYQVTVNGRKSMQIFGRQPVDKVQTIEAGRTNYWLTPEMAAPPVFTGTFPVDRTFGDEQARLLGYDLNTYPTVSGQDLVVTLYWQALTPFDRNFQTFVHLVQDEIVAQHDGAPECNINPTTRWEPGQIVPDPHVIPVPHGGFAGSADVMVGMYDLLTLERLRLVEGGDDILFLDSLTIKEYSE